MPARKKVKGKTNAKRRKSSPRKTGAQKKSATFRKKRASPRKAKPKAKSAIKSKSASSRARRVAATPTPSLTTQPAPPGERVGVVTHYYSHLSVATLRLESGTLRVGDVIHIRGHTTDFSQRIESLEINHVAVAEVGPNDDFGLKVVGHVREHDVVYKVHS